MGDVRDVLLWVDDGELLLLYVSRLWEVGGGAGGGGRGGDAGVWDWRVPGAGDGVIVYFGALRLVFWCLLGFLHCKSLSFCALSS